LPALTGRYHDTSSISIDGRELGTSRIRNRSADLSTATFGVAVVLVARSYEAMGPVIYEYSLKT
jgi:hypothetical protein